MPTSKAPLQLCVASSLTEEEVWRNSTTVRVVSNMDWNRIFSGALAVVYLGAAYFAGGPEAVVRVAMFLVLPLACIWYGDELGSYTGVMRGQAITAETPGCLVRFAGWLLLLLPLIIGAMSAFK